MEKNFAPRAIKKKYCNSRVVQKKFSGPRKNHNPPTPSCKLNGRSLMGGIGKLFALAMGHQRSPPSCCLVWNF